MSDVSREPWELNGRQVAAWLGVSTKTVSQRNYPNKGKYGAEVIYDIREVFRVEGAKRVVVTDDGDPQDHEAEKLLWTKSRRIAQDLENYERTGLLAPVEVFASAFEEFCGLVSQTLEGLPGDIRRADPEISARSLEIVEVKVAEFRNLAADKCASLSQGIGDGAAISERVVGTDGTENKTA